MKASTHPEQLISLSRAINEWLMDCKLENKSPATLRFYRYFTKGFLADIGDRPIGQITPDMVRLYFANAQDGHQHAHASRFRAIRRLFRWAVEMHYIEHSPVTIKPPKVPEVIQPTLSAADCDALLKACSGKFASRDKAILLVFMDTGARLGEMTRLKLDHVSLEGRLLKLLGKGNKERIVAIRPETARTIWQYYKWRTDYAFGKKLDHLWISDDRKPLTQHGIELVLQRVSKKAGVANCHPHAFRHTFAQNFLEAGGNPLDLQYLLGHTTLEMVRRYSRFQEQQRAIQAQRRIFEA